MGDAKIEGSDWIHVPKNKQKILPMSKINQITRIKNVARYMICSIDI